MSALPVQCSPSLRAPGAAPTCINNGILGTGVRAPPFSHLVAGSGVALSRLPLHPVAGLLLKVLATHVSNNRRKQKGFTTFGIAYSTVADQGVVLVI